MIWAVILCALGAVISALVAVACNKQYRMFASTNSGWLEFWLATRIIFLVLAGLFTVLLVAALALSL